MGGLLRCLREVFTKETEIPPVELNRAIARKNKYVENRGGHTFKGRKQ